MNVGFQLNTIDHVGTLAGFYIAYQHPTSGLPWQSRIFRTQKEALRWAKGKGLSL